MKLLLINPPFSCATHLSLALGEPLGLAYVAAAVEASGRHQVAILDGVGLAADYCEDIPNRQGMISQTDRFWVGLSREDLLGRLEGLSFDVVGFTLIRLHESPLEALPLAAAIRSRFPDVPIILGGPEASLYALDYIRNPDIDFIVQGEGEVTLVELLDHLEGTLPRARLRGVIYRGEDGRPVTAPPQPAADIDALPWPARHLLPMATYFRYKTVYTRAPAANILTSRACPFLCAFCGTSPIWGRRWRGRSPETVLDEMEFLVREYGVREIRIQDDNFVVDRARAEAICDGIVARGLDIALHIEPGVMLHLATRSLLDKLKAAGLVSLNMQLESGLEKTQTYINKKIDMGRAREMVAYAKALGLRVGSNIIIGFHFETVDDMRQSVSIALSFGYDYLNFVYPYAMPNTRLRTDFMGHGLLAADQPVSYPLPTLHATAAEVAEIIAWGNETFRQRRVRPTPLVGQTLRLEPARMDHRGGHCWHTALPEAVPGGDTAEHWESSQLRLVEDDHEIGPAHCTFTRIKEFGRGRFSHRPGLLLFSASDNSEPQTNGRVYTLQY